MIGVPSQEKLLISKQETITVFEFILCNGMEEGSNLFDVTMNDQFSPPPPPPLQVCFPSFQKMSIKKGNQVNFHNLRRRILF